MVQSNLTFNLKYKKELKKVCANGIPTDLVQTFKEVFSSSNALKYPKNSFYFQIKDRDYGIEYNLEDPHEIYENAIINVKVHRECLPISLLEGETPVVVKKGPMNAAYTVKVKGLPWECTETHIRKFFDGLAIPEDGIYINYNTPKLKRHNGDAFVEFIDLDSAKKALEKTKQCIFTRSVDVIKTNEEEITSFKQKRFESMYLQPKSVPADEFSFVVKLLGLPWDSTYSDILNLFDDIPITAIHFPKDKIGRPNGCALVEVADEELAARALGHHREYVGKRFVDIRRSTIAELLGDMSRCVDALPEKTADKNHCIFMKNIPPSLNNFAIDSFFTQDSISPFRIHKKVNGTEAYCEFIRQNDFARALGKNGSLLGGSPVEIFEVSYEEVAKNVGYVNK